MLTAFVGSFVILLLIVALVTVIGQCAHGVHAFFQRRRMRRAAKEALRQQQPPVSRHATLNPAEFKAKRY